MRHGGSPSSGDRSARFGLVLVLLVSAGLGLIGIDWGLPSDADWSVDSVDAQQILQTHQHGLARGWLISYPPLHARVLAVLWSLVRPLAEQGAPAPARHVYIMPDGRPEDVPVDPQRLIYIHTSVTLMARLVSVLMGLGTLGWVYAIGRRLWSAAAGVWAALLLSWTPVFVFYSHVSNREVPQLFWLAGAIYFFVRCGQAGRRRHYLGLAAMGALAGATKDQALGALPLMGLSALWWVASEKPGTRVQRLAAAVKDPRITAALATFLVLLAVCHDLPWNWRAFVAHVEQITGPDREGYRQFAMTPLGEWQMLCRTAWLTAAGMGWPLALGGLAAVGLSLWRARSEGLALSLLVPALSYYVFFLSLVLYVWVRWTLPLALIVCLYAGRWLAALWHVSGRWRWLWKGLAAAGLAATFWYGASASLLMVLDSRYEAEAWIADWARRHRAERPWVLTFSGPAYLPRWLDPELYVVPAQRIPGLETDARRILELLRDGAPEHGPDPLGAVRGRNQYRIIVTEMDLVNREPGPTLRRLVTDRWEGFVVEKRFKRSIPLAPNVIDGLNPGIYVVAPQGLVQRTP